MAEYIVDTTDGTLDARTTGEVIRCRDCADCISYYVKGYFIGPKWNYECARHLCVTWSDGYCAWARRRDDGSRD